MNNKQYTLYDATLIALNDKGVKFYRSDNEPQYS